MRDQHGEIPAMPVIPAGHDIAVISGDCCDCDCAGHPGDGFVAGLRQPLQGEGFARGPAIPAGVGFTVSEEIISSLQKHWEVDSVDDVTPRDIAITREGRNTKVRVAYDVTRPFFRNIDLVIHFDEAIEAADR
jgi:hypothetical protein